MGLKEVLGRRTGSQNRTGWYMFYRNRANAKNKVKIWIFVSIQARIYFKLSSYYLQVTIL